MTVIKCIASGAGVAVRAVCLSSRSSQVRPPIWYSGFKETQCSSTRSETDSYCTDLHYTFTRGMSRDKEQFTNFGSGLQSLSDCLVYTALVHYSKHFNRSVCFSQ